MANRDLAKLILEQLEEKPHTHNQQYWFRKDRSGASVDTLMPGERVECGTTLCVAGWAAYMNGYMLTSYEKGITTATLPFGPQRQVPDVAQELLGISEMDAYILFHNTNNDEAIMALEQLVNGKDHIEWLDIFGDDEEGRDYFESVMDEFYGTTDYSYDYEN